VIIARWAAVTFSNRILLVCICCLLFASQARAQTAQPDQKAMFAAYLHSPGYKAFLDRVFNMGEPTAMKAGCASLKVVDSSRHIVMELPTFVRAGANYNIDTGLWVGSATLDRCGQQVTRRALLKAIPGTNNLDVNLLLPGDFRGNLKLEADAKRFIFPGLMAHAKCSDFKQFKMLDIKALTPASPAGWSETWIADACGTKVEGEVTYTSTGDGMNVTGRKWKLSP
jgi:hypothetical protein